MEVAAMTPDSHRSPEENLLPVDSSASVVGLTAEDLTGADELRGQSNVTRRLVSPGVEELLYKFVPVLDRGFIRVIDYFGSDEAIVQAARVSYGKGTKKSSDDRNLIRYLMRHRHSTPFEMCEIKLHVKLPIFVARQWIRHRTANVNEYSARYSVLDKEFYVPDRRHVNPQKSEKKKAGSESQPGLFGEAEIKKNSVTAAQSQTNRQGRGQELSDAEVEAARSTISKESSRCYTNYLKLLNENEDGSVQDNKRSGIARELARMVLPTNYYTQWYWKIDLNNLFHFLSLRADSHAQYEIRVYADEICKIVERWCPIAYEAFKDYRMTGVAVSGPGMAAIKRLLAGEAVTQENSGLGKREWTELMETLGR
jgi:thymidylate synthase (FAD)